jgi:hypothetical protein
MKAYIARTITIDLWVGMISLLLSVMSERASCRQYHTDAYAYGGYFLMIVGVLTFLIVQVSSWVAGHRAPHIEASTSKTTQRERICGSSAQHGSVEDASTPDRDLSRRGDRVRRPR